MNAKSLLVSRAADLDTLFKIVLVYLLTTNTTTMMMRMVTKMMIIVQLI